MQLTSQVNINMNNKKLLQFLQRFSFVQQHISICCNHKAKESGISHIPPHPKQGQ